MKKHFIFFVSKRTGANGQWTFIKVHIEVKICRGFLELFELFELCELPEINKK